MFAHRQALHPAGYVGCDHCGGSFPVIFETEISTGRKKQADHVSLYRNRTGRFIIRWSISRHWVMAIS